MVNYGTLFVIIICVALFIAGPGLPAIIVIAITLTSAVIITKHQNKTPLKAQLADTHYLSQKIVHHYDPPRKPMFIDDVDFSLEKKE